jgi:hypothetical protein
VWRTSQGDRVLGAAEWGLFRAALAEIWDLLEDSEEGNELFWSGLLAFDDLQRNQKIALLSVVGKALRDPETPTPELTAHSEAAVAAVFEHVRQSIEVEVDEHPGIVDAQNGVYWRSLVLAAFREVEEDWEDPLPDPTCTDLGEWLLLLECLSGVIFWDSDYDMGRYFLDADPEEARERLRRMTIAEEYYVAVAPDPDQEELEGFRRTLRELAGRPEREEPELIPGLDDLYHGLLVGPCTPDVEEGDCRLVQEIGMAGSDGFDCTHEEWATLFRDEVLRRGREAAVDPDPNVQLSLELRAAAQRAAETSESLVLPDDHRIEPWNGGWVVRDKAGSFLLTDEDLWWVWGELDPDGPIVAFASPEKALAVLLHSEIATAARSERYEAARQRLEALDRPN